MRWLLHGGGLGGAWTADSAGMAIRADAAHKVKQDRDIEKRYEDSDRRGPSGNLVDLHWQEGSGDDHGEPLGPALQEPEADSFRHKQARIDEANDSQIA